MDQNEKTKNWICVYKTSSEADADAKHELLTEFGIESFIEDWGNTTPTPFGASTIARNYQVNVNADDLKPVKKIFRKMEIDGGGFEGLSTASWLKPAMFFLAALFAVGIVTA